jgi:Cu2+-exporting ATPase
LIIPGADEQFCCNGCAAVYRMIHGCDLSRYYELRKTLGQTAPPIGPSDATESDSGYRPYDEAEFLDAHTSLLPTGLRQADLRLSNVHCAACLWLIEKLPRVCPGVVEARLSLRQSVARVTWDPDQVSFSKVALTLHRLGYPPHPAGDRTAREVRLQNERDMLVRIGIAGACAGNAMLLATALYLGLLDAMAAEYENFFRLISVIVGIIALAWPGSLFFRGAWAGLKTRSVTLDLPIALALGVGGVAGLVNVITGRGEIYFDSLCVLVFLLLVGRYLQMRQQRHAVDSVTLMQSLTPVGCTVWRGDTWVNLPIEAVVPGDRVRIPSNQRLSVDGFVLHGQTHLDTASLTGEALPTAVGEGDAVFAGTRNVGPAIEITVQAVGPATRLSRLMEEASADVQHKPAIVRLADRIAGWFTLAVLGLAGAVLAGWWWAAGPEPAISHAVALLIVACPCALGLATPLTLAMSVGVAARRDILVKDAAVFEKLGHAHSKDQTTGILALDKTGTITAGQLRVTDWVGDPALQPLVGLAEQDATHPVGQALHDTYGQSSPGQANPFTQIVEDPRGGLTATNDEQVLHLGNDRFLVEQGIALSEAWQRQAKAFTAQGASVVWVAWQHEVSAFAVLQDTLQIGSAEAVAELRTSGWQPVIFSGDSAEAVRHVAASVGIATQDGHAQLAPEDKPVLVRQYRGDGRRIIMVGDGVNDTAALAAADVGIAVKGGVEAAMAVADVYTARPGLAPLTELIRLSRFTVQLIRRNLVLSLGYNALAVSLAAAGLISPWLAAILMPISSLTVLSHAVARLTRWQGGATCP